MQTRPELLGSFGMVASTHWLASASGMSVLEQGGNAFDAAVAAGFVMQIVEPHLSGPGGDLVALAWTGGAPHVVCGQGVSPAAATLEHFSDLGLALVPGSGPLAATVPGAFGGWTTMLERWGTWELADVLAYALHYAESGFPLLASDLGGDRRGRRRCSASTGSPRPTSGSRAALPRLRVVGGRGRRPPVPTAGCSRKPSGRLGRRALPPPARAFYQGFVAQEIDAFSRTAWRDTSGRDHAGLLTADDLAPLAAGIEAPVAVDFAGRYEVLKAPAWSQGPVLGQQLRLLDELDLLDHDVRSADWIHLVVESAKLAFADREAWYGDRAGRRADELVVPGLRG